MPKTNRFIKISLKFLIRILGIAVTFKDKIRSDSNKFKHACKILIELKSALLTTYAP